MNESMSPEAFLDAIDRAAEALDRSVMRRLETIAFARRNVAWQSAVRHADNYIVAMQRGNTGLADSCAESFRKLVATIRN